MKRLLLVTFLLLFLAPAPPQAAEVKLSAGGLTLNANLEVAEGGDLADGVVVIVHGLLAHNGMETVATLQHLLAERDLNSLAINLGLGLDDRHGMYDCAVPHTHKVGDALDEIAAWIAWLEKQGAADIVLAGHSNGGRQAAWFAAERDRAALKKVVLIAPGIRSPEAAARRYKERYQRDLAPLLATAQTLVEADQGGTMMADTDFLYCPRTSVSAASFVSYYDADPRKSTVYNLARINKPVLVVAATADQVVTGLRGAVQPLADGERLRYAEIEGAGHFFLDFFAEDLADVMARFIAGTAN